RGQYRAGTLLYPLQRRSKGPTSHRTRRRRRRASPAAEDSHSGTGKDPRPDAYPAHPLVTGHSGTTTNSDLRRHHASHAARHTRDESAASLFQRRTLVRHLCIELSEFVLTRRSPTDPGVNRGSAWV